jgi:hypothetical protein
MGLVSKRHGVLAIVGVLVVAGLTTAARQVSAASTTACASAGTSQWTDGFNADDQGYADAIAASPDGSTYYVTGTSNLHFLTVAYDACTGAELWTASYQIGGGDDVGVAIAVSPDGSAVFVTGGDNTVNGGGYSTVAYNAATGAQLWAATYDPTSTDNPTSMAVSPDGSTVFVTGVSGEGLTVSATVAYNASTGTQLWATRLAVSEAVGQTPGHSLAVSPDGSTVYFAGYSSESKCNTVEALATTTGAQQWASTDDCGVPTTALALSPDGSTLFVTGSGVGNSKGCLAYPSACPAISTVAYDTATGNQKWAASYGVTGEDVRGRDLVVSPDGSKVFVSGTNCGSASICGDYATVAYDAVDGSQLWATSYADDGDAYETAVGVSPDGSSVFVTGGEGDGATVAYDAATGAEQWVADSPGNSELAMAVNPNGSSLLVAGSFVGSVAGSSGPSRPAASKKCTSHCGYATAYTTTRGGAGAYQDTDPAIRYNGWSNVLTSSALGGMYRPSHKAGDSVVFRTIATKTVTWLTYLGPNMGKAKVLIDGKSKGIFDLYRAKRSAGSFTFTGLASRTHTVKLEVLGTKDAYSTGATVGVSGFKAGYAVTLASSPSIRYDTWAGVYQAAASRGSIRQSGSAAAWMSFTFTGRDIAWITETGPGYGRARVTIDGVARPTVDLYRKARTSQVRIFYGGLSKGKHTITIRPLGAKDKASTSTNVVFDAFRVGA